MTITKVSSSDPSYPASLARIHVPPKDLYYLGKAPVDLGVSVAVVGSRRPTAYGIAVTKQLSEELARRGVTIISGLALGVDALAHQAALKAGGRTIAVMPGGLDRIYPATNHKLARDILVQGGTLLSEYPVGMPAAKHHFIARNRIVAGLADAILVTEAAEKSGTLITVRYGLEQGKTILSVPGNITSVLSKGTNNLIRTGATPVTEVIDILHAMGLEDTMADHEPVIMNADEQVIVDLLRQGITHQEDLLGQSNLPVTAFNTTLTMLEITGRIESIGQGQWILR